METKKGLLRRFLDAFGLKRSEFKNLDYAGKKIVAQQFLKFSKTNKPSKQIDEIVKEMPDYKEVVEKIGIGELDGKETWLETLVPEKGFKNHKI